jgi:spore coat protein CotH
MTFRSLAFVIAVLTASSAGAQTPDDFFNPDVVHRLDLLVNSRDWEKLQANFQTNDYYPADVRWNGITVQNVGIRVRGLSSRSPTKPALRVDMNRYTTGQQFLGLKSFLLDNLVTDPTGIKERVVMRFYQRLGFPAPREAHAALYVNNAYAGLYVIIESIDKDFLARAFGESRPGDTENDGYLFEYDWVEPWFYNYLGSDLAAYATRYDPQTHEQATLQSLYAPIEAMVRAINEAPDASFTDTVGQYLDVNLLMRQIAIQNFVANDDGIVGHNGTANFHFYRFEQSTRSQYLAWDEDRTFVSTTWGIRSFQENYVLTRRAMAQPSVRSGYYQALLDAAASAVEPVSGTMGWMEYEIRTQRALITPFMHADTLKPYTNAQFDEAMNALELFPAQRAAWVRCEVAQETGVNTATACASR